MKTILTLIFVLAFVTTSGCFSLPGSILNRAMSDQTAQLDTEYPMYKINDRSWVDQNEDHCDYLGLVRTELNRKNDKHREAKIDSALAEATHVMGGNAFFILNADPARAWAFNCPADRLRQGQSRPFPTVLP